VLEYKRQVFVRLRSGLRPGRFTSHELARGVQTQCVFACRSLAQMTPAAPHATTLI